METRETDEEYYIDSIACSNTSPRNLPGRRYWCTNEFDGEVLGDQVPVMEHDDKIHLELDLERAGGDRGAGEETREDHVHSNRIIPRYISFRYLFAITINLQARCFFFF